MKLNDRLSYGGEDIPDIADPIKLFSKWFSQAQKYSKSEPNAMTLATASKAGIPSVRELLLREFSKKGYVFYSNANSEKGKDLKLNPSASIQFYWPEIHKQIRIMGKVKKLPSKTADIYFQSRPRGSQLAAYISSQSQILPSRKHLLKLFKEAEKKFNNKVVPKPQNWIGYILTPTYYEFWSGKENRLHDRLVFKKQGSSWKRFRIFP